MTQEEVIIIVGNNPLITQKDLFKCHGLKSYAAYQIRRLEQKELIIRKWNGHTYLLTLTSLGLGVYNQLQQEKHQNIRFSNV